MSKKKVAEAAEEVAVEEVATEIVPEAEEEKDTVPVQAKAEAKKFPLENLQKNARALFGVGSCTFAGATAGLAGEFTVEEIKCAIDEWCRKEAK